MGLGLLVVEIELFCFFSLCFLAGCWDGGGDFHFGVERCFCVTDELMRCEVRGK